MTPAFTPEQAILELGPRFYAEVEPASFPDAILRWRNQRWAERVGLGGLSGEEWTGHFARFEPLSGSLPRPLALAYHGHQFQSYNPQIGDGRGFLYAQLRDGDGRLLDLGTKGSGQTPWSRGGDGRLTLKGGVREVLAAQMLEAQGVYTSKPFSMIETGEELFRHDEPSPARSCVLVRLSHSHVRFGTFQRLAYLGEHDAIADLVAYCIRHFYPQAEGADLAASASNLFREIAAATARLAASWMAAGFVHGVLNTDNMVVTGESFDYGPWRFLPHSDPAFTAAYFDHTGLYAFGRQPAAAAWNLSQLGGALAPVTEEAALQETLNGYAAIYRDAFRRRTMSALGLACSSDEGADLDFMQTLYGWMTASEAPWAQVFFDWFGGAISEARALRSPLADLYRDTAFADVRAGLAAREPERPERLEHAYFREARPASLVIEEVEAAWAPIAESDDWSGFHRLTERIEQARQALA
ncbi:MAG: YdiU family protein [Hyphomonadaceae bacterium]